MSGARTAPAIGTPRSDALFFFAPTLATLSVGLLVVRRPEWLPIAWWLWLALVDGPHFASTWARTYLDRDERRRRGPLLAGSLLWILPGFAALFAAEAFRAPAVFQAFLGFATLWSWHHAVRQHYGILSLYQRLARAPASERALDSRVLYGALWGMFGFFMVAHPANRALLGLETAPLPGLEWGYAAFGAVIAAYGAAVALRWRSGRSARAGLFLLVGALVPALFTFAWVGAHEPLLRADSGVPHADPERIFLAVAAVGGVTHGIHYLGIIFAASRRRYAAPGSDRGPASWLGLAPGRAYLALALVSLAYLAVNGLRGVAPGSPFPLESLPARLALCLYWGLAIHHYYLDQRIWRPHADAALRGELGLA